MSRIVEEKHYPFLYHYYRAEVYRETNWRNRLDVTTNWAIVVTAAILSYTFSNPNVSHVTILINYVLVLFFLYVESRRYRYYSILRTRTKLVERDWLAKIIAGEEKDLLEIEKLKFSLENPKVVMTRVESIAWRLRRNYIFIIMLLFGLWISKALGVSLVLEQAAVWIIPGWLVLLTVTFSVTLLAGIAVFVPVRSGDNDLP